MHPVADLSALPPHAERRCSALLDCGLRSTLQRPHLSCVRPPLAPNSPQPPTGKWRHGAHCILTYLRVLCRQEGPSTARSLAAAHEIFVTIIYQLKQAPACRL